MKKLLILSIKFIAHQFIFSDQNYVRLNHGWKFAKEDLGGVWEAVGPAKLGDPESLPIWEKVTLPHCFNAYDAVDPDVNYYQGPGWYRNSIEINNSCNNSANREMTTYSILTFS